MEQLKKLIEKRLGYELPVEKQHTIADLKDVPTHILDEARKLNTPILIEEYLRFYVDPDNIKLIKVFVQREVLKLK